MVKVQEAHKEGNKSMKGIVCFSETWMQILFEHPNNNIHLAKVSKEKEKETLTTEYLLDSKDQVHCFIYMTEQTND